MASRRLLISTLVLVALLFVAVGVAVAASSASVAIRGSGGTYSYAPRTQYIRVGGTVTWRNTSDAPHTVTSTGGGPLNSGIINPGRTYRATFSSRGTYPYICEVHGNHTGRIVVLAASAAPPETDTASPAAPDTGPVNLVVACAVGIVALLAGTLYLRRISRTG